MGATRTAPGRAGTVLIYVMVAVIALLGVCSLAVDWGRVQVTRTELTRTANACARYAVTGTFRRNGAG